MSLLEKEILAYIKDNPDDEEPPRASQVKQKFGALRFYMTTSTDKMEQAIEDFTLISSKVCEVCGQVGMLRGGPWLETLCEAHANEKDRK